MTLHFISFNASLFTTTLQLFVRDSAALPPATFVNTITSSTFPVAFALSSFMVQLILILSRFPSALFFVILSFSYFFNRTSNLFTSYTIPSTHLIASLASKLFRNLENPYLFPHMFLLFSGMYAFAILPCFWTLLWVFYDQYLLVDCLRKSSFLSTDHLPFLSLV